MILIGSGGGRKRVHNLHPSFLLCLLIKGEASFCIDLSGTSGLINMPRLLGIFPVAKWIKWMKCF